MSVLTLAGRPINWAKPPKASTLVMWSQKDMYGRKVTGSLRTIAHLDYTNTLAKKKFGRGLIVIQPSYNRGVAASAGTHDYDACLDVYIPGVAWSEQQKFFRANGWGAYWRKPPKFGNHIHMFSLPVQEGADRADDYKMGGFKVGKYVDGGWTTSGRKYTSAQIDAYYAHRDALASNAKDTSWFPASVKATIFDLPAYIKTQNKAVAPPKPAKPAAKTEDWYTHKHLNTWGDDGGEGTRTLAERRPQMVKDAVVGKPEVITLNEVKANQVAGWQKAFKSKGYSTVLAEYGNLVAVLDKTRVDYSGSYVLPKAIQGEGRKEAVGRVRALLNGHWTHIIVTHLDYRKGAKFDTLRVKQADATIGAAERFAKSRKLPSWKTRTSFGLDENSETWVRDKAFIPAGFKVAIKVGIDAIYSARAVRAKTNVKTKSDHPLIGVTYGKKT